MKPNYTARKSVCAALSFSRIALCILILPIFYLVYKIIETKQFKIEFYDNKIITYSGLINFRKKQSVFMGVTETNVEQTLFGQLFNYGSVNVDCVGKWDIDTTYIKDPYKLEKYLQSKVISSDQISQHAMV